MSGRPFQTAHLCCAKLSFRLSAILIVPDSTAYRSIVYRGITCITLSRKAPKKASRGLFLRLDRLPSPAMTVKVGGGLHQADSGKNLEVASQAFSHQLSAFLASGFACQNSATMVLPGQERTRASKLQWSLRINPPGPKQDPAALITSAP